MLDHTAQPVGEPIDMVLFCPQCGVQHVDAPEAGVAFMQDASGHQGDAPTIVGAWDNPPHRSHLCHACGHVWRPADVPTNGVPAIKTAGKADSPIAPSAALARACDLLSTIIGTLMSYRTKIGYTDDSPIAAVVNEAVTFLAPWPEKLPTAPALAEQRAWGAAQAGCRAPSDSAAILSKICDLFHIGQLARTESTILTNVENVIRFTGLLRAVERDLFPQPDLPEDDDPYAEREDLPAPNSWGAKDEADYVAQFRAALAARAAAPADVERDAQKSLTDEQINLMLEEGTCIHGKGFQCVACWPHPAAPSDAVASSTKDGGQPHG